MKKVIVIGVTGGIACYKICDLVSRLRKKDYEIHVIMTKNATQFVQPLTFQTLSNNKVCVDTFEENYAYDVNHISLASKADLFLIAPCTANVIAKTAHGIADDMLTTTFLASTCPKVICPAMNNNMYENPITLDNIEILKKYGIHIIEPEFGHLACNANGKGRLANIDYIECMIEYYLEDKPLRGINVLVSAGATQEKIDPVRYITNHSTGKMGYAIARQARKLGANVTLVSAKSNLAKPYGVNLIDVTSSKEMFEVFKKEHLNYDFIIKAAAVSDYTIDNPCSNKIKKNNEELELKLSKTQDILKYIGQNRRENQIICGFAMETENLIENATKKLLSKNIDMIIANSLTTPNAGFGVDTNVVSIITENQVEKLDCMLKDDLAKVILLKMYKEYQNVINH